ncbi:amino acid/polyamine/organocation transporter, APC superfamily [Methanosarcina thermophila]|jgi:APA family basic amino acid/polyamine antiporter|uniref:Amino acid/polyamine/organocation transporter, APC superfamily n=3 Tax=Methanosarcina thermophila TaxID=2210 RepID=A0A1I7AJE2_METTE|nr:APC family permease [Methanosarcina thermophila]ALK05987.1 MAG: amino acid transporter [Methanosarcina sp. 795]AKB12438.1 Amino acid transporter [Methanosarcina thermophila TM-1]AKB14358.1 Amino acid transporter [Methanosarcina thermophila CHTI-55]NLU57909.1 amino acid permease [Methanosarcina thermophila]SFT75062.1 amino acid/polyamine/organocation transporter, APC superfamily [Methanosarcina thermophila]
MKGESELKKELSLLEATLVGIGNILGAGIYVLMGKAAGLAGNMVWFSFLFAGAAAALSALSYMELSSMYPRAGAEYEFVKRAFGERAGLFIGLLVICYVVITASAIALGFGRYFSSLFGIEYLLGIICLFIFLSFIMVYGIKESARLASIISLIEVTGLLIVIYTGFPYLGTVNYFEAPDLAGVFEASTLIFFAFLGFEDVVRLSQETKEAEKTTPKALLIAIFFTVLLYMCVAVTAVSVLDFRILGLSNVPLADVVAVSLGSDAFVLMSWIALFSTMNTVLVVMLGGSRIVYGMADAGSLPESLSRVHHRYHTPWVAIFGVVCFSALFVLLGDIAVVANISNFMIFIVFFMVNLSLIKLRYTDPDRNRPYKVPLNIGRFPLLPFLGALSAVFLFFQLSLEVIIYGLVISGIALLIALLRTRKKHLSSTY